MERLRKIFRFIPIIKYTLCLDHACNVSRIFLTKCDKDTEVFCNIWTTVFKRRQIRDRKWWSGVAHLNVINNFIPKIKSLEMSNVSN